MSKLINTQLDRADLKRVLRYDPETGIFWRYLAGNRWKKAGGVAGMDEHISIFVKGHQYTAHSLAWFYMRRQRRDDVYHLNGDKQDNRWSNLAVPKRNPYA